MQFLGLLAGERVDLASGSDPVGRLCRVMLLLGDQKQLILWRARELPAFGDDEIVGASTLRCIFFPAADTDLPRLEKALLQSCGPGTPAAALNVNCDIADPDLAATVAVYLQTLFSQAPDRPWASALDEWCRELQATAGVARTYSSSGDALHGQSLQLDFMNWIDQDAWNCPVCADSRQSWTSRASVQTINAGQPHIFCDIHGREICKSGGRGDPVSYSDLGACLENRTLYVWKEERAWPTRRHGQSAVANLGHATGYIEHHFGRRVVRIQGNLLTKSEVLLDDVAFMARPEADRIAPPASGAVYSGFDPTTFMARPDADRVAPVDIPVRAEYAWLIESCEAQPLAQRWSIKLKALPQEIHPFPAGANSTAWSKSTILVWPPQKIAGWHLDYIAAAAPTAERLSYRMISEMPDGSLAPVSNVHLRPGGLYRIDSGSTRYIELEEWDGGGRKPLGLMNVTRGLLRPNTNPTAIVALYFGTSSSAVHWKLSDGRKGFLSSGSTNPMIVSAHPVTFNPEDFGVLKRATAVLLSWLPEDAVRIRPYVPSLLAEPAPEHAEGCPYIPSRENGLRLYKIQGELKRVFGELKWDNWSDPKTRSRVSQLVESLLIPSLWELVKNGVQSWSLRVTFPLAFDTEGLARSNDYRAILNEVLGHLCGPGLTGLPVTQPPLFSESAAALALLPHHVNAHEFALDLGGGTLDVAVTGPSPNGAQSQTLLAADSLPYGARAFLRAIVTAFGDGLFDQVEDILPLELRDNWTRPLEMETWIEVLELVLQSEGIPGLGGVVQRARDSIGGIAFQELAIRWKALLAGIQLYLRRMLEGTLLRMNGNSPAKSTGEFALSFNLLGQGWELLRLFDLGVGPVDFLKPRILPIADQVAKIAGAVVKEAPVQMLPSMVNPKTAVVEGVIQLSEDQAHPLQQQLLAAASRAGQRHTFLGVDLKGSRGRVLSYCMPLSEVTPDMRPDRPGDPGYAELIDSLWTEIPDSDRELAQHKLLKSSRFKDNFGSASERLISLGQTSFNDAWLRGTTPRVNLLAHFLENV
jgi:hypothetical protein